MCRRFSSLVLVGLDGFVPALDGGTLCSLLTRAFPRRIRRTRGGESGGCAVRGKHNFMWIFCFEHSKKILVIIKYAMDFMINQIIGSPRLTRSTCTTRTRLRCNLCSKILATI